MAAAVPPRQLEANAIVTPIHSFTPLSPVSPRPPVALSPRAIVSATTWQVLMSPQASFAASLRRWRRHRGLSQLDLAALTEISQRHLSFMELGRASPSRDMVMRLAAALDVPLRQHNALLISAGFAPVCRQTGAKPADISSALDYM